MTDLLITNGTLVTLDGARTVVEDGALAIDGGRIVALGATADVLRAHPAATTTIDAGGNPVLPGFVNAHFHSYSVLHRGASYLWEDDLWRFLDVVYRRLLPAVSDPAERHAVMLLPLVEMIKAGITCTLDLNEWLDHGGVEASLRAFEDAGMRGVVARSLMDHDRWDVGGPFHADVGVALRETAELARAWRAHERVDVWFYPVYPQQCSDELMAECARLAEQEGVGVATHLHEVAHEVERWRAETGCSPIAYYHERGIPFLSPRVNAGHCVHVDARDIEILYETGVVPVHNPMTNGGLGAGLAPVPAMLDAGIPVALGVDDGPADMFEAMKTALLFQKVAAQDSKAMTADAALTMATRNGARALLQDDVGELRVGAKADVIVLDLAKPHTTPVSPPLPTFLTYCATPESVDTVVIDGRVVMRERAMTLLDEAEVVAKAQAVMDRVVRSGALDAVIATGARA